MGEGNGEMPDNRIPAFPDFKRIEIEDREEIDLITRQYPPYSDFNFTNLFCHDTAGDCQISILHGNLAVRFRAYITHEPFFSFLGHNKVADTIDRLLDLSCAQSLLPVLRLVPESSISSMLNDLGAGFTISEDPDSSDYLIDVREIMELASARWRNKRKVANRFKRAHPHYALRQLELHNSHTQQQIRHLFHIWTKTRNKVHHETRNELAALGICQASCRLNVCS